MSDSDAVTKTELTIVLELAKMANEARPNSDQKQAVRDTLAKLREGISAAKLLEDLAHFEVRADVARIVRELADRTDEIEGSKMILESTHAPGLDSPQLWLHTTGQVVDWLMNVSQQAEQGTVRLT